MGYGTGDAMLVQSATLPSAEGASATPALDIGPNGATLDADFRLRAEALATDELAVSDTVIYSVESAEDEAFSSPRIAIPEIAHQIGDGGANAIDKRFRLPSTAGQFVRIKATKTGDGDASNKTMTLDMLF